ncbi:MAG: FkbM family methyltransferase [Planctomycetes bacterium]|nr:FkbM family methyltransferase [Planctomycetota bacterium]
MTTLKLDHLYRAQFGEDRILWQVFGGLTTGYFIEVGAFDGITLSNTYFLEQMGWSGLLIEPIRELCERAAAARPRSRVVWAAASKRGSAGTARFTVAQNVPVLSFLKADPEHVDRCVREGAHLVEIDVPVTTLDKILLQERKDASTGQSPWVPGSGWRIDLVSIDTEGCELDVLDGFSLERFKPRVLVLENDRPGGGAIEPYLKARGYRKFHRQKINDFYVRTDLPADSLMLDGFFVPE